MTILRDMDSSRSMFILITAVPAETPMLTKQQLGRGESLRALQRFQSPQNRTSSAYAGLQPLRNLLELLANVLSCPCSGSYFMLCNHGLSYAVERTQLSITFRLTSIVNAISVTSQPTCTSV